MNSRKVALNALQGASARLSNAYAREGAKCLCSRTSASRANVDDGAMNADA